MVVGIGSGDILLEMGEEEWDDELLGSEQQLQNKMFKLNFYEGCLLKIFSQFYVSTIQTNNLRLTTLEIYTVILSD